MKAWRRTETRVARPFFALTDIEPALDGVTLLLGEEERESYQDHQQLDPADFEDLQLKIRTNIDIQQLVKRLDDKKDHFQLIMALRDPMLKKRVTKNTWNIEEIPNEILLDEDEVLRFGHRRELHITLALALCKSIEPNPGWPTKKGDWIAKRSFVIKTNTMSSAFDLRKMTADEAKLWTGFRGALIHVDYIDGRLLEEPEEDSPLATCYIAEDVYDSMQRATEGPLLQSLVMTEVVAGVLLAAGEDIEDATDVPKGVPLERILNHLGADKRMGLDQLKSIIRDPLKLRAAVHDRLDVISQLRSL